MARHNGEWHSGCCRGCGDQSAPVAVPGLDKYYENDLDFDQWGLARAAQVDSYRGFVFATLDPTAIPLVDFLYPCLLRDERGQAAKADDGR